MIHREIGAHGASEACGGHANALERKAETVFVEAQVALKLRHAGDDPIEFTARGCKPCVFRRCAEQFPIDEGLQHPLRDAELLHESRVKAIPEARRQLLALTLKLGGVFRLGHPPIAYGGHRWFAHHEEVQGTEAEYRKHGDNRPDNQPPKYPPGVLPHGLQHALPRSLPN